MSIVFERNNSTSTANNSYNHDLDHRIGRSGFGTHKMICLSIYSCENGDNSSEFGGADRAKVVEDRPGDSTSSTSSIGRNSDESTAERSSDGGEGEEVQSQFKGGALDNLEALEEVLPIKRSISNFYSGKSKSFTSLADTATCSSIKEIVKPENAYTRKRKNLLAYSNFWDKNSIRRSSSGGISKRHTNSRSTLALAATMGRAESNNNSDSSNSNSPSGICLPPLPPQVRRSPNDSSSSPPGQKFSPWRSFSLSDLQGAAASPSISGITVNHRNK